MSKKYQGRSADSMKNYIDVILEFLSGIKRLGVESKSITIYGSASRGDLIAGKSDVDILFVTKESIVDSEAREALYRLTINLQIKYGIKIHLRIRNITDLFNQTAGMLDCGFTSCINKIRDGICLCGESMDDYYLDLIYSADANTIQKNLEHRFSKLKYDIRALTSTPFDSPEYLDGYALFTLIAQLAELVLYSKGVNFVNKASALKKAFALTKNNIFSQAVEMIALQVPLHIGFDVLCKCEEIIELATKEINPLYLERLKRIELEYVNIKDPEQLNIKKGDIILELSRINGIIKKPFLDNGKLIITKYHFL